MQPVDRTFQVGNLTLAARVWDAKKSNARKFPVLALHGWLDNCASFDPLARKLGDVQLVAVDLAGHGHSSHRSEDSAYNLWQDVDDVLQVADQLGWSQFSLLGHSRGAMISVLLAAVAPERVSRVALIDGLVPTPVPETAAPKQLARAIRDKHKYIIRRRRRYSSLEAAAELRTRGDFPLSLQSACMIAERGLTKDERGYFWSADQRLQGASEVKFSEGQLRSFLQHIEAPVQLYLGADAMGRHRSKFESLWQEVPEGEMFIFPGGHHLHMDGSTKPIARQLNRFLSEESA